jgi:hypothetical protein
MAIIYFDEAGNTGSDLMNREQTLYVLSSSIIQENKAKEIIENYFGKDKTLHFKKLKQSKANQKILINLLHDNETILKENIKSCYYDKKFLIVCQMLNYLFEPQVYDNGIDYYDNGMNIAHANMFYICSYSFCGTEKMDKVLKSFVDMIRTYKEINLFFRELEDAIELCLNNDFKMEFYTLLRTEKEISKYLVNVEKYILDPAIHALIGLIEQWLNKLNDYIDIVHDRSNSVNVTKKYLEILININTNPINIGYGEYKSTLPLKVNSFRFESSELSYSIQLCDLIASSIFFINNDKEEIDKLEFKEELIQIIKDWNTFGSVSPSMNVLPDPKRKKQKGDINPIDYIAYKYSQSNQKI